MSTINSIQSQVEKKAELEATQEFSRALDKCTKILSKFYADHKNTSADERSADIDHIKSIFVANKSSVTFTREKPPIGYIKLKKQMAVTEFINRVEVLSEDLDIEVAEDEDEELFI